ncbi:hypothetical protein, partial [Klebsiella pneumoniae]|uniref:hypothetical protein n=1 Tax=Klebsiella pneumoniae TaxID=573 RepID=UPI0024E048AA
IAVLRERNKSLIEQQMGSNEDLRKTGQRLAQCTEEISQHKDSAEILKMELANSKKRENALENQNSSLDSELHKTKSRLEESLQTVKTLKAELGDLNGRTDQSLAEMQKKCAVWKVRADTFLIALKQAYSDLGEARKVYS